MNIDEIWLLNNNAPSRLKKWFSIRNNSVFSVLRSLIEESEFESVMFLLSSILKEQDKLEFIEFAIDSIFTTEIFNLNKEFTTLYTYIKENKYKLSLSTIYSKPANLLNKYEPILLNEYSDIFLIIIKMYSEFVLKRRSKNSNKIDLNNIINKCEECICCYYVTIPRYDNTSTERPQERVSSYQKRIFNFCLNNIIK